MQQNYDITVLRKEAQIRWLKPSEVLFILQNHENYTITSEPPQKPPSGSLFLFNRRILRFFRKDGHSWRRKKDGRTVGEAHERLKVGNVEALNCYYAHGDQNPYFQRRSYWILNPAYEHIVLVHYREVSEGRYVTSQNSNLNQTSSNSNTTNQSYNSTGEVTSNNNNSNRNNNNDLNQALKQLAVQLSLEDYDDYIYLNEKILQNKPQNENKYDFTKPIGYKLETKGSPSWKDMFELSSDSVGINIASNSNYNLCEKERFFNSSQYIEPKIPQMDSTELRHQLSATRRFLLGSDSIESPSKTQTLIDDQTLINDQTLNGDQTLLRKFSSNEWMNDFVTNIETNNNSNNNNNNNNKGNIKIGKSDFSNSWFDEDQLIGSENMRFFIKDISPEWAFSSEKTKVIITGHFQSDPSDPLTISFGNQEVPSELIQEGVLRCYTPPQIAPGKIPLFVKNRDSNSTSQILDFEFREKQIPQNESNTKSDEELTLLYDFAELLLNGGIKQEEKNLFNIVEELLKEKLRNWLKFRVLTKREMGIIHFIAGLGFEWGLNPVLESGVGINFRDKNGWTALHWAAYFGREKMVAALLANRSSPTAVTDPTTRDPSGRTPASLASSRNHAGLAAYLSESALNAHLSSLNINNNNGDEMRGGASTELDESLEAVRNAAQAAARIQTAFRAFSFRKRRQNSIAKEDPLYGISQQELNEISSRMHVSSQNKYDKDRAALSIQKKYRGWKGRRSFLTVRNHVVKIQAVVRGHQVRKKYREFIWSVSIVEKAVLRWRRKGQGFRGFKMTKIPLNQESQEEESEEEEDEDIMRLFRKEKVDNALEEAVSRVLCIVESEEARVQYKRMIERFKEAKEEMSLRDENEVVDTDGFMY